MCNASDAWVKTFLRVTEVISERSHCCSKKVCAIAVKDGRIIGTGINGSIKGSTNCDDVFKDKDMSKPEVREEHHKWALDHELHAEQNLVLDLAKRGVSIKDAQVFVSLQPCENCARLLAQTGISDVYWSNIYDKGNLEKTLDYFLAGKIRTHIICKTVEDYKSMYLRVAQYCLDNCYDPLDVIADRGSHYNAFYREQAGTSAEYALWLKSINLRDMIQISAPDMSEDESIQVIKAIQEKVLELKARIKFNVTIA